MEKSFLELLGEEKRALLDAESSKESAVDFLNKAEMEVDPEMKEIQKRSHPIIKRWHLKQRKNS